MNIKDYDIWFQAKKIRRDFIREFRKKEDLDFIREFRKKEDLVFTREFRKKEGLEEENFKKNRLILDV